MWVFCKTENENEKLYVIYAMQVWEAVKKNLKQNDNS